MDVKSLNNNGYDPQIATTRLENIKIVNKTGEEILEKIKKDSGLKIGEEFNPRFFDKLVEEANQKIMGTNKIFKYSYHEKTKRVIVRVVDRSTDDVIREIPPENTLDAAAKMMELVGILVDEKV